MMREVYFDNSSTTQPFDGVIDRMSRVLKDYYGNPSSLHRKGLEAEEVINEAKEILAGVIEVKPSELIFTSGGTESNNHAIKGIARRNRKKGRHIVTTAVEHRSVLNSVQDLEEEGFEATYLPVNELGRIEPHKLKKAIRDDTILVSIMHVNNETGALQPLDEVSEILFSHSHKPYFHVDAVQSLGKIPLALFNSDIDLLTMSSHKVHGPKGTGALFIREGVKLKHLLSGGGQEKERRSGTENVPGIAGFAQAISEIHSNFEADVRRLRELRNHLANQLSEEIPGVKFNTPLDYSAPHILNVSFPGIKAEVLLRKLESKGIYVSTSSACNSRKRGASHVLKAMGISDPDLEGALRFSLSVMNSDKDVEYCVDHLIPAYQRLLKMRTS